MALFIPLYAFCEADEQGVLSIISLTTSQQQIKPGHFVTVCVVAENPKDEARSCRICLKLPEECESLTGQTTTDIDLLPRGTNTTLFALRMHPSASAGVYPLKFQLEEDHLIIEEKEVELQVLSVTDMRIEVDPPPPYIIDQLQIVLHPKLENCGNCSIPLTVDVRVDPSIPVILEKSCWTLDPGDASTFSMTIDLSSPMKNGSHYVFVKIYHAETGEILAQDSLFFEKLSSYNEIVDMVMRIPGYLSTYSLLDRGHWVGAVELAGGGPTDESLQNFVDFFFRVPTDTKTSIYNIDQELFVGFSGPRGYLNIGDASYSLSPLTERFRYARGAGGRYFFNGCEVGGFWAKQQYSRHDKWEESAVNVALWKKRNIRFASNYLYKDKEDCPKASIGTVQLDVWSESDTHAFVEYGYNFKNLKTKGKKSAFAGKLAGRILQTGWYCIEKNNADLNFLGYFTNFNQTSGSFDIPLKGRWRFGLSGNTLNQKQMPKDRCRVFTSIYQREYNAHLSYYNPCGLNYTTTAKLLYSKDLLNDCFNFRQYWGGLDVSFARPFYSVIASLNYGQNDDRLHDCSYRNLQRYYLYLFRKLKPYLDGYLLGESGHIDYFDTRKWQNGISGGLRYHGDCGNWAEFSLKHVANNSDCGAFNSVNFMLNHVFSNQHELHVRTDYYHCNKGSQKDRYQCLLRYTVPLSFPVGRKKQVGCFKGRLLHASTHRPVSYAVVNVEGQRVATNQQGFFTYNLPVGTYPLTIESTEESAVYFEEEMIHIEGGMAIKQDVYVQDCGDLDGSLVLYQLPVTYEGQMRMLSQGQGDEKLENSLSRQGGIENVRVTVVNYEKKMVFTTQTNRFGNFHFGDIPCGRWTVVVEKADIPEGFVVKDNERQIEIKDHQHNPCDLICYPRECEKCGL